MLIRTSNTQDYTFDYICFENRNLRDYQLSMNQEIPKKERNSGIILAKSFPFEKKGLKFKLIACPRSHSSLAERRGIKTQFLGFQVYGTSLSMCQSGIDRESHLLAAVIANVLSGGFPEVFSAVWLTRQSTWGEEGQSAFPFKSRQLGIEADHPKGTGPLLYNSSWDWRWGGGQSWHDTTKQFFFFFF